MAKIMQVECNGKTGKRSFTRVDTTEPPLIFYKNTEINYNNRIICRFLSDFIT